ncbi:MAG: GNAT family N-acetyltransferase [Bacteroidota bacterium]
MTNFPELTTERLRLAQPRIADIPRIVQYAGDAKVAATTQNMPHPYHEEDAIFWLNMANTGFRTQTKYIFGIRLNTTDELIGGMGLHLTPEFNRAELGYWIGVPFWNKGYATEAAGVILKFGFEELELNKIHAVHIVENPASGKVMIKNGMIKEGELKEHYKKGAEYRSVMQYRLTRMEYQALVQYTV